MYSLLTCHAGRYELMRHPASLALLDYMSHPSQAALRLELGRQKKVVDHPVSFVVVVDAVVALLVLVSPRAYLTRVTEYCLDSNWAAAVV